MNRALVLATALALSACVGPPPTPCTKCGDVCVDTKVDPANCGGCGTACAAGKICTAGACKDNCPSTEKSCGGKCVDVVNDPLNCGTCGTNCGSGMLCAGGSCVSSCPTSQDVCGNKCVDKQVDPRNCGACNAGCDAGQLCSNGACGSSCAAPLVACNGQCVNLQNDPANCGACATACAPMNALSPTCVAGSCSYNKCQSGFTDCDNNPVNGCEVSTSSDVYNCGGCANFCLPQNVKVKPPPVPDAGVDAGTADAGMIDAGIVDAGVPDAGQPCGPLPDGGTLGRCYPPSGAVCIASTCGYEECQPGFADCDGVLANGCETNTRSSLTHCGGCNLKCTGPDGVCVDGACLVDRPSYHFPLGGQLFPATEPQFWEAGRARTVNLAFAAIPPATLYYTTNGSEPLQVTDGGGGTNFGVNGFKLAATGDIFVKWFAVYGDGRRELYTQTYRQTLNTGAQGTVGGVAEDLNFAGGGFPLRVVDAGTPLSFSVTYQTWKSGPAGYCPTCAVAGAVNFDSAGQLNCSGIVGVYPGATFTPNLNITAPMSPGAYYVRAAVGLVNFCNQIGGGGEPVGVVIVR